MTKGYKVTNENMQCLDFQFELGKKYKIEGNLVMCVNGFHFCQIANNCFDYHSFITTNRVFEIQASGEIIHNKNKSCAEQLKLIRELTWFEVLTIVNTGDANTGRSNSGYRNSGDSNSGNYNSGDSNSGNYNSGYRNSGNYNSGYRNSGDSNSGYYNSGDSNSGDRNSGKWNSGNYNSGYRNSGDSNSGYRNSGAFCRDNNPYLFLFDKPTKIKVKDWENSDAARIMRILLDFNLWVPMSHMTDEEKKLHPKYETTEGYLKTISLKEAWANMWGKLEDEEKEFFTDLPNFSWGIFTEITGIKNHVTKSFDI